MRRLFGTDGVRGIANAELTPELATSIGKALCTVLSSAGEYRPTVLIGTDTRRSGEMLAAALAAGVCSAGGDIISLGTVPTPAVAYLVRKYELTAGVVISASHNPYEYNGIKIFSDEGIKLSDELEEEMEIIALDKKPSPRVATASKIGRFLDTPPALGDYTDHIRTLISGSLSGIKIGIDCANGAAFKTAKEIFLPLGAKCVFIGDRPNGVNINQGCGSTSLNALSALVKEEGLDAGIAFDGDADRCLAVDEYGNEVDGDFIMAILARDFKERGLLQKNGVVGTVMTNLGFVKFCEENGINFHAAKVGDRYVSETMRSEGLSFGGEQSGHLIIGDYSTTGDGELTAVLLLDVLKRSGKTLSALASVMKKYPQYTLNLSASAEEKIFFLSDGEIKRAVRSAERDAALSGGRIVVRPSGTEPFIRIMAEGADENEVKKIAGALSVKIKQRLDAYRAR